MRYDKRDWLSENIDKLNADYEEWADITHDLRSRLEALENKYIKLSEGDDLLVAIAKQVEALENDISLHVDAGTHNQTMELQKRIVKLERHMNLSLNKSAEDYEAEYGIYSPIDDNTKPEGYWWCPKCKMNVSIGELDGYGLHMCGTRPEHRTDEPDEWFCRACNEKIPDSEVRFVTETYVHDGGDSLPHEVEPLPEDQKDEPKVNTHPQFDELQKKADEQKDDYWCKVHGSGKQHCWQCLTLLAHRTDEPSAESLAAFCGTSIKDEQKDELPRCLDCGAETSLPRFTYDGKPQWHVICTVNGENHTAGPWLDSKAEAIAAYVRRVKDREIAERARAWERDIQGATGSEDSLCHNWRIWRICGG